MSASGAENEVVASPPQAAGQDERSTWFAGKLLFWSPIVPLVVLDLWSKAAAFAFLAQENGGFSFQNRHPVFDWGLVEFELVTYLNPGTIWGLFGDWHAPLKVFRVFAVAAVVFFAYRTPRRDKPMQLCLGLILAGALGNLYDNLFHDTEGPSRFAGAVRDFIHFHNSSEPLVWDFPAFNVADSCISVGAFVLFLLLWRKPSPAPPAAAGSPGES